MGMRENKFEVLRNCANTGKILLSVSFYQYFQHSYKVQHLYSTFGVAGNDFFGEVCENNVNNLSTKFMSTCYSGRFHLKCSVFIIDNKAKFRKLVERELLFTTLLEHCAKSNLDRNYFNYPKFPQIYIECYSNTMCSAKKYPYPPPPPAPQNTLKAVG